MGVHDLDRESAEQFVSTAVAENKCFDTGEKIVLEKQENALWHGYYECWENDETYKRTDTPSY